MQFHRLSRTALLTGASFAALATFGTGPARAQNVPQDVVFGDMIALTGGNVQLPDGTYAKWQGAENPVIGTDADGSPLMTIKQTRQKALLDWESFSLKTEEILEFQQQAADWIAVNRVHGEQASQIDGTIRAPGRVFIFNDNGVLFGEGANVDVRQLVTGKGVSDVLVDGATTTIVQKDERAILNWSDMSSQAGEILRFQQEKSDWIAMNRSLADGTTRLAGDIEADGHIYLIAPEGLAIAGSVEAQQVIASSLNMSDRQFEEGLNRCLDCNNSRHTPHFSNSWMPNVSASVVTGEQMAEWLSSSGPTAVSEVVVEDSATIATGALGKIMLFGNHVTNEGILSVRDEGQVILAAGENIWLNLDSRDGNRFEAFAGQWDPVAFSGSPVFARKMQTVLSEAEQQLWLELTGTLYPIGYTFSREEWGNSSRDIGPMPALLQERIERIGFEHALSVQNTARNSGIIRASRGGNVDFRGWRLEQMGAIEMTSTASFRGKINLDARLYAHERHWTERGDGPPVPNNGTIVFGEGSLTQITPDLEATDTIPLTEGDQSVGSLVLNAFRVHMQDDSMVYMPSGTVNVWLDETEFLVSGGRGIGQNQNNETGTRFMMERGATIDLSGWESTVLPMGYHQVTGKLFAAQLADSPLQREGPFYRKEITVDRRYGTDLANWESFDNLTQGTLDWFLTDGGSFAIDADNDFIMKSGSLIDVSGGKITYEAGTVTTTLVRTLDGRVIDIREADPDQLYMGLANEFTQYDLKWGEQETYLIPFVSPTLTRYEEGYVEGGNAGSIDILAPDAILQGTVLGGVTVGKYQREDTPEMGSFTLNDAGTEENEYKANSLIIAAQEQLISANFGITDNLEDEFGDLFGEEFDEENYADGIVVPPTEKTYDNTALLSAGFFDRSEMGSYLLIQSGPEPDAEGNLPQSSVFVESGVALDLGTASFDLRSERGGVQFDGTIRTLGGDVSISGASLIFGAEAAIDTSAGWYSEYELLDSRPLLDNARVDGGDISLGQVNGRGIAEWLEDGVMILPETLRLNLGGGAWAKRDGTIVRGKGGSLSVTAFNVTEVDLSALDHAEALGLGGNGALSLSTSRSLFIGESGTDFPLPPGWEQGEPEPPIPGVPGPERPEIPRDPIVISPDLFKDSGFSAIHLSGERLMVAPGTRIEATPLALRLKPAGIENGVAPWQLAETGTAMSDLVEVTHRPLGMRPEGLRRGMDLSFSAANFGYIQNADNPGAVLVGEGSSIVTEAGGTIGFTVRNGQTLDIRGTVQADGGTIALTSQGDGATIRLGSEARLLARGAAVTTDIVTSPDGGEWRDGYVLDGGTIQFGETVTGTGSTLPILAVAIEEGAVLDVSGAQATFDIVPEDGNGGLRVPTTIASDGGSIEITAQELDIAGARYFAQAGGSGASGGSFLVDFRASYEGGDGADIGGVFDAFEQYAGRGFIVDKEGNEVSSIVGVDLGQIASILFRPVDIGDGLIFNSRQEFVDYFSLVNLDAAGMPPALVVGDPDIPFEFSGASASVDPGLIQAAGIVGFQPSPPYDGPETVARLPVDSILAGGFSNLTLSASPGIVFAGDVALGGRNADGGYQFDNITLATPNIVGLEGANVTLEATTVDLKLPEVRTLAQLNLNQAIYIAALGGTNAGGADSQAVFTARSGVLTDIAQANFTGFGTVGLESDGDIRLRGYSRFTDSPELVAFPGHLRTTGDLRIRADQLYAASGRDFLVKADRSITVLPQTDGQAINGTPYEAAAILTLEAPRIVQGGTVRSPLGAIVFNAIDDGSEGAGTVSLLAGSVTSVSSDGNVVPYGALNNGDTWLDPLWVRDPLDNTGGSVDDRELRILPERAVTIQGADIDLQAGAQVDLSGGGDLFAGEFTPGVGGTQDWLSGYFDQNYDWVESDEVYAILPGYDADVAPVGVGDAGPAVGQKVYLSGGSGLEAGYYTLLPAEFARLPGAFRVTAHHQYDGDYTDVRLGESRPLNDGSSLQAGYSYVGDLNNRDQRTSAFLVMPRETLFARSQYNTQLASEYFGSAEFIEKALRENKEVPDAPRTPLDGGSIVLAATRSLNLAATLDTAAGEGGRGGLADIQADMIAVVGEATDRTQYEGYLQLDSEQLNSLGAESLLLGGIRRQGEVNLELTVGASDVVIDNEGAVLSGPELIFASLGDVTVKSGSSIETSGAMTGEASDLRVIAATSELIDDRGTADEADDVPVHLALDRGAIMRLSANEQIDLLRDSDAVDRMAELTANPEQLAALNARRAEFGLGPLETGGVLDIEDGASVVSSASLTLDGTIDTLIGQSASVGAPQISAASSRVSVGAVPAGTEGLVFAEGSLGALAAAEDIVLKSYSSIDFYGETTLRADGGLTLDARTFRAVDGDGATVTLAGSTVTFANSNGGTAIGETGGAALRVEADNIYLSGGDKWLSGVEKVDLVASERVIGRDENTLHVPGALAIDAAAVTAESGARQFFDAEGAISLTANGNAALDPLPTFGATLGFTGASIVSEGQLALTGGTVELRAREGDVVLAGGSVDVTSDQVEIFDKLVGVGAGNISLVSDAGDILVGEGALVDVSGTEAGGDAGRLTLTAGLGDVRVAGTLRGEAAEGYRSGSLRMTSLAMEDFGGFNAILDQGGFRQARAFEINSGNVSIDSDVTVREFTVVANDGSIDVSRTIETPGENGGRIQLSAARDVTLAGSAQLLARAGAEGGSGGTVFLETVGLEGGTIDIAAGSLIDVSGSGEGGRTVRLRAPQVGGNDVAIDRIDGTITGARSVIAEAFRVYDEVETIDQDVIDLVSGDAADFMQNAPAINARLGEQVQLAPGIELRNDGDMELVTDWDLSTMRYDGAAGVLTLRAAGDLLINANLSDGFDGTSPEAAMLDGTSWTINLTGGANIASPNSLAVLPQGQLAEGKGSVVIGGTPDTIEYYQTAEVSDEVGDWEPEKPDVADSDLPADIVANYQRCVFEGGCSLDEFNEAFFAYLGARAAFDGDWAAYLNDEMTADELRAAWPVTLAGVVLEEPERPAPPFYGIENRLFLLDENGRFVRDGSDGPSLGFVELERDWDTGKYIDPRTGELIDQDPETGDYVDTDYYARRPLPWAVASGTNLELPRQDMTEIDRVTGAPGQGHYFTEAVGYMQTDNSTGYLVRTGTGAINVASGRDFVLQEAPSVLYTAGVPAAEVTNFEAAPGGYTPTNGGDITLNVAGSIDGTTSFQLPSAWLEMVGDVDRNNGTFSPGTDREYNQLTWHVRFDRYRAGIGALGGGNVTVRAGGDINELTVNIPTTGRIAGGRPGDEGTQFHQTGGGNLSLRAGGNIRGGIFYVGDGLGEFTAGGAFTGTPGAIERFDPFAPHPMAGNFHADPRGATLKYDFYPLFYTSNGTLRLSSGGDLNVEAVLDPFGGPGDSTWNIDNALVTLTPDASVEMFSSGGDIRIWDNVYNIAHYDVVGGMIDRISYMPASVPLSIDLMGGRDAPRAEHWGFDHWPATLRATAAAGDIQFMGGIALAPSATGNLELIARGSVQLGAMDNPNLTLSYPDRIYGNLLSLRRGIEMSQALPEYVRTPDNVFVRGGIPLAGGDRYGILHAGVGAFGPDILPDLHVGDLEPARVYAGEGKVVLTEQLTLPKAVRVRSAGEIYFPRISVQHNNPGDLTLLKAGGGIYFGGSSFVTVAGQGRLEFEAGGDFWIPDNAQGIVSQPIMVWPNPSSSYGEQVEAYPGRQAADIAITVGLEREPDYAGFADWLFNPEGADTPDYALIDAGDGRELPMYLFDRLNPRADRGTDPALFDADLRAGFVNYIRSLQGLEALESEAEQGLYLGEAWDYWVALPAGQETPFDAFFPRGEAAKAVDPVFYLPETSEGLVNYVRRVNGMDILETQEEQLAWLDDAWAMWESMAIEDKTPFYRSVLNMELRTTGREANDPDSDRYNSTFRGYDAIAKLFPGAQKRADEELAEGEARWDGDFETFASRVLSRGGGDIDFVIPGGELMLANVAATDAQTGQPTDEWGGSEQGDALRAGLITENGGAINVFAHDSVTINRSRVLTAKGGNVLIWSSYGDIAAGAGAKTSISPAYYDYSYDDWYDRDRSPAGLPTGAGIGTLASVDGAPAADVDLIAPNGIVDAGDAGIRVSGNFNVFAVQILGTDNIDVSGISTGLPVPPAAPPTSLDTGDVAAQANRAIEAITDAMAQAQENASVMAPSIIEVRVTGYGCPPEDLTCEGPSASSAPAAEARPERLAMVRKAAVPAPVDRIHTLSIPPQPLKQAIGEVSRKTGTDVIYDSDVPVAGATRGVQGRMTVEEALRRMVRELGLEPVKVGPQSIVLRRRS
ncbi:filamentous hemagglutinin family protein [Pelagerythrobacter marensis]|uniref:Filamentous hemagglutinin family protein n=1 Tax=Pelagerythrobacter marensis TaxID=543877 RepID=A0ABZ2DAL0_9SPHN